MNAITMIAVSALKVADDNVRQDVGDVSELAQSIKSVGLLEPLLVREGDHVVVCGARRLAAAKKAGLKEVPVIARAFTEQERLETMIVENLQRDDLTPVEEAVAFSRLATLELTQRQIAEKVGRSQAHVAKRLSLLTLPEKVQKQVAAGGLRLDDAQELAKLKDDPKLVEKLAKKEGPSITSAVKLEVEKRAHRKKYEAAHAALVKKSGTVVELVEADTYGYRFAAPEGMKIVLEQTMGDDVQMKPSAHAKLDCHAAAIQPRTLAVVEVCTTPANHPSVKDGQKAERAKAKEAAEKERHAFEAMTERRREFVRAQIAARVDKDVLLELCWLALADNGQMFAYGGADSADLACDLLKIEVPLDDNEEGADADELLAQAAGKSVVDRLRVTFALAAAEFEVNLSYGAWRHGASYFELLEKLGYKVGADEKKRLSA